MQNEYPEFENIIGCYFNQDYHYPSIIDAVNDIILGNNNDELLTTCNEIASILKKYTSESQLKLYLHKIDFCFIHPRVVGFPSYKEFLLYLKNEFQKHIDSEKSDESK